MTGTAELERRQDRDGACRCMSVLAQSGVSGIDAVDRPFASSYERGVEAEVLLQAVTALHRDGILTDAEYETKRQRLAAQL